jgi:hypothetical protein
VKVVDRYGGSIWLAAFAVGVLWFATCGINLAIREGIRQGIDRGLGEAVDRSMARLCAPADRKEDTAACRRWRAAGGR